MFGAFSIAVAALSVSVVSFFGVVRTDLFALSGSSTASLPALR